MQFYRKIKRDSYVLDMVKTRQQTTLPHRGLINLSSTIIRYEHGSVFTLNTIGSPRKVQSQHISFFSGNNDEQARIQDFSKGEGG